MKPFGRLVVLVLATVFFSSTAQKVPTKPNILLVLTDDQDVFLGGMTPMTKTKRILQQKGATFTNMFTTTPICCPSRSSILTGRFMGSHQTYNNSVSGNCSSFQWQQGPEKLAIAAVLKNKANYTTFFAGKYLNQYGFKKTGGVQHVPPGWDSWNALVGNSKYYNYTLSINGKPEIHGSNPETDYLTDVLKRKALGFLESYDMRQSFFMMVSTPACHAPFTPQVKYSNRYSNVSAPRTPNFFKYYEDKHWLLRQVPKSVPKEVVNFTDNVFRNRWRTLLSVDDLVYELYKKLQEKQLLENTYIFFSSDNGFHLGQFSLPIDKRQMYEFDIRIPLLVAGPGIKHSSQITEPVLNIDLAPSFLDLAGVQSPRVMNGESVIPLLNIGKKMVTNWREWFIVDYRGEGHNTIPGCPQYEDQGMSNCRPDCICEDSRNNTYDCIRILTRRMNTMRCYFKDRERFVEFYNLTDDIHQQRNLAYDYKLKKSNPLFGLSNDNN